MRRRRLPDWRLLTAVILGVMLVSVPLVTIILGVQGS